MHNPSMYTSDGKFTTVVSDFDVDDAKRAARARVCHANGAGDVLEMLGIS